MLFFRYFILVIISILLIAGCKKKAEEQTVVPVQVDTMPKIDTMALNPVDTMAAVEEAPGMPPAPTGSGFSVQLASATDEKYARYLVELWKSRGYEPFVTSITHDSQTYYRVRLGLFQTNAEANRVVAELADKYSLKTWIDQGTH
ncbi:MAG TPA: SPOR domain-containing protein [candidate division Zixibacteria bacterium]|nr:SPOR domain-containing protein [candidate division Zixibacteria bacterium]